MTEADSIGEEEAPPPSPFWLRVLPLLLATIVVGCAGAVVWLVLASPQAEYSARAFTAWHAGEAIADYDRLRQALVASPTSGTPPARGSATVKGSPSAGEGSPANVTGGAGALLAAFNQSVTRLREPTHAAAIAANPAIDNLVQRLIAEQNQLPDLARQLTAPAPGASETSHAAMTLAASTLADGSAELARLNEAVNREGAVRAEQQKDAADRQRSVTAGLVIALAAAGLLMVGLLVARLRDLQTARWTLLKTGEQLKRALETASRAEANSARFITAVGRDLRAPMDSVIGLADSLLEQPSTQATSELAGGIKLAGGELARALDDALDHAALQADSLTLRDGSFSPEALTSAALAGIEARARAKGLTTVAVPAPGLPRLLLGDGDRIGRVLARLLANAVRFTEQGGISLQILCKERNAISATLEWVITDSGPGMDPARIDLLFGSDPDALARLDDDDSPDLGLALCRRLVSRMGGGMAVESTVGEGTRFRVRLPLRVAPAGMGSVKPASAPSAAPLRDRLKAMGRRPRLLMAEDTPAGQFIMRQLLAREGIAPDVVGDGRAAVRAAEQDRYDVICLDLRMPDMDGLEAARRIRSGRGPSANAPIIAVTAHKSAADIQACQSAGMTMFIEKPVGRETLLNAILASLSGPEGSPAPTPAKAPTNAPIAANLSPGIGHEPGMGHAAD